MTRTAHDLIPREIIEFIGAEPTQEQWRAISWPLEPCVVVAGAGSGKTSVMAARVIWLALRYADSDGAEGALPGNVLCLTFTNKATENLVFRIRKALSTLQLEEGEEPEVTNYHGFAQQLLERYGMLDGIEPGQRVIVLTWLHLARRDVLRVHPRDDTRNPLRGVFSTRSADRPNPIGLHEVEVLAIEGARMHVRPLEAVDGTPVLDVKPVI